jgi:hypothetical protein
MGVFAPGEMISREDGERLIEDIRRELAGLSTVEEEG